MMSFEGEVIHGSRRAALLGYPTINIELHSHDVNGIYAAKVCVGDAEYIAAAFADPVRGVLEAHLLDISADLYGKHARIDLYEKVRDSRAFEGDDALKAAMASDVSTVRAYFMHR